VHQKSNNFVWHSKSGREIFFLLKNLDNVVGFLEFFLAAMNVFSRIFLLEVHQKSNNFVWHSKSGREIFFLLKNLDNVVGFLEFFLAAMNVFSRIFLLEVHQKSNNFVWHSKSGRENFSKNLDVMLWIFPDFLAMKVFSPDFPPYPFPDLLFFLIRVFVQVMEDIM
jgi:hypothetical protein